jgi:hypothetical protein
MFNFLTGKFFKENSLFQCSILRNMNHVRIFSIVIKINKKKLIIESKER